MGAVEPGFGELFAGRYELRELLIRTNLGPAFLVDDRDLGVQVGLLLLDDTCVIQAGAEGLRKQVREARRVTHHNVARTYDIGEYEGRHYVTVEYIDGLRLPEWLAEAPDEAARLEVIAQVADGLAAAHEVELTHGNITPANIIVERGGRAVLGNFGLPDFDSADTLVALEQRADDLFRSVLYLAPEQVKGQALSPAADVYALTLLLYEVWIGDPRYRGDNPMLVANARLDDTFDDLRAGPSLDARVPSPLADLMLRCLAVSPSARPSAAELAAGLRAFASTLAAVEPNPVVEVADTAHTTSSSIRRCDSLAVLPFRYRGPSESDYLAEALVDELVDLLSATQGMRVYGAGVTARYTAASDRDPKHIGAELGVDVLVDGTLMVAGDRLRISARLIEVEEGFQLWHERFEGSVADVFELQDKLAKRMTEALRVELEVVAHRGKVDPEATEAYLRGRQAHLAWQLFGPEGALAHYQAALELAPEFKPALAHFAAATVLAWFMPREFAGDEDWEQKARDSVAQAMALAPELPESRFAAATLAAQLGEPYEAAVHLHEAVRSAPTFALAHEFLGRMLVESGRAARGIEHLELAADLDPALRYCYADVARYLALSGDMDGFAAKVAQLVEHIESHRPSAGMLHVRVGAWTEDLDMIRRGLGWLEGAGDHMAGVRGLCELLFEPEIQRERLDEHYTRSRDSSRSPRLSTFVAQFGAELYARHGHVDAALECVEDATANGLLDINWLDRCPPLAILRSEPRFVAARATVRARGQQVLSALGLA